MFDRYLWKTILIEIDNNKAISFNKENVKYEWSRIKKLKEEFKK